MPLPAGTIVKNSKGQLLLVESASIRAFPDLATFSALTIGFWSAATTATVTDAAIAATAAGAPFPSVATYVAANPRAVATITRIARALVPTTGLKDLAGGVVTLVESAAALYADAVANPGNWAAPISTGSKAHPLPDAFSNAATQVVVKLLNDLLSKLTSGALSLDQTKAVGSTLDDIADDVDQSADADAPIPAKDAGEKEDPKEVGDKEAGEKEAGDKDEGDKEAGDKEVGEKDAGDKDAGDKDAGDKDAGDKDAGEKDEKDGKEAGEKDEKDGKEAGDKDGEKDDKDDDGDGGEDGGEDDDRAPVKRSPASVIGSITARSGRADRTEWDEFVA